MTEKNDKICNLDGRLNCAAAFVRQNSVIADIGTDHAYLPVYLLKNGIVKFAVASDINRGPLERAVANAGKYGVTDKMRFVLTDGLEGLEPESDGVTDIIICGMGGELIADIISASEYTKKSGIRLILQPMSYPERLRMFLAGAGYRIVDEKLCEAVGKLYTCILAEYDGVRRNYSKAEYLLGERNILNGGTIFIKYANQHAVRLEEKIAGMKKGGLDVTEFEECLAEIQKIIGGLNDCT